jgi:hypothetical protein
MNERVPSLCRSKEGGWVKVVHRSALMERQVVQRLQQP